MDQRRTRARAPRPVSDAPCCQPVTIAHFVDQRLVGVYQRHVGIRCMPSLVKVPVAQWRKERGLR